MFRTLFARLTNAADHRATDIDLLHNSPMVDPVWYRETYIDLRGTPIDVARHYIEYGAAEGRNPHPLFDTKTYLGENPDVAASGINPLVHWLRYGQFEKRPFPYGPERRFADLVTIARSNTEVFQASAYATAYPDVAAHLGKANAERMSAHWQAHGFREGRAPFGFRPYHARRTDSDVKGFSGTITYYGFFDAPTGMGSAARGYLSSIRELKREVRPVTVIGRDDGLYDTDPDSRAARSDSGGINIFHINADMVHKFFYDGRRNLLDDSFNIGIWAWELAHFRVDWASAFGAMDEIWVPSEFCRTAISAISPVPVFTIPHIVEFDEGVPLFPRSYFRIPSDVFVFGCIFDVGSAMERKNPEAAICAFIKAFGNRSDVLLAIKYHEARYDRGGITRLHSLAAGRANIRFYGRTFSEQELVSFKTLIDCYLSPHRCEGFGLNIAEAMLLEKPVIATNYSGNIDFMDQGNSFPINYRLVEVGEQIGPYPPEALWAEPDIDDLIFKMRFVIDNPTEAALRARVGRERLLRDYSAASIQRRIKARFDDLGLFCRDAQLPHSQSVNFTYRSPEEDGPKISIVVPVYDMEPSVLMRCVCSVVTQTYRNWELILHDDGSQSTETLATLQKFRGINPQIKVSFGKRNQGIAEATNFAIGLSSGEFIGFLDNDDELASDALAEMAAAIRANDKVDLLYSDEDKIDYDGSYCDHYFKPDWSPEHLESVMYLMHFLVVRRSALLAAGGLRALYSGAQDYDLALRISRVARRVVHVPKILYHWRKIAGSASAQVDAKPYGLQRAEEALRDHIKASGRAAIVTPGLLTGLFRVRDVITPGQPVTLAIFTDNRNADFPQRGKINLFDHLLESIVKNTETVCSIRLLAIDNGNLSESQRARVEANGGQVVSYDGPRSPFNFSKKVNFALKRVKTELLVLLNDDMEVISPGWLDALVELAKRPTTGVVGARLLFPDDRVQHCGIVLGINGHVAHIYHQAPADLIGYNGYTHLIRNYLAVTGACMATRMSLFDEVGGFDEALAVDYNDIDFCLRVHSAGYRNIYTPFAQLYHFEGATQARTSSNRDEHEIFTKRWSKYMNNDPFYNQNLTKHRLDFSRAI